MDMISDSPAIVLAWPNSANVTKTRSRQVNVCPLIDVME